MEASRLRREDLREPLGPDVQRVGAEVRELDLRLLGCEQPDTGTLLRARFGEDELGSVLEDEPKGRRLRSGLAASKELQPSGGHQVHEENELAVLGREQQPLRTSFRAQQLSSFERAKRRVERLQRRDMRRSRLEDRK